MTDSDFKLNAQQKLKIVLFPELSNPTGIDKKNIAARNTHLKPIIENIHSPEPNEPYLVQQEGITMIKYQKIYRPKKDWR